MSILNTPFQIEKILDKKYLIKWKNHENEDTWETEKHLIEDGYQKDLDVYNTKTKKKTKRRKARPPPKAAKRRTKTKRKTKARPPKTAPMSSQTMSSLEERINARRAHYQEQLKIKF